MKTVKCPNCGAHVSTNKKNGTYTCEYCNSSLICDEPIDNNSIDKESYNSNENDTRQTNSTYSYTPRPQISVFLAVVLCWINIFVGLAYIAIMKKKQYDWDRNNH